MPKSLLIPMTGHAPSDATLDGAARLTKASGGALMALFVRPDPRTGLPALGEPLPADMVQDICNRRVSETQRDEDKARGRFAAAADAAGLKILPEGAEVLIEQSAVAQFQSVTGDCEDLVGRRGRVADIVVCEKPANSGSPEESILSDVLFKSGTGLLMLPGADVVTAAGTVAGGEKPGHGPYPPQRILIGWNGRTEAAQAVRTALPFLKQAAFVKMIQVGDMPASRPGLRDVSQYLALHGVSAEGETVNTGGNAADALLHILERDDMDMLVIGAYSHSRWRELVLGGVTRTIIATCPCAVLMCH